VSNEINIDNKFARLQDALQRDNEKNVQDAMFDLGATRNGWTEIPDEVVERILTLLRNEEMYKSPYANHVLDFFEYESPYLTDRQKWLCISFLNAHGNEFSDVHSQQVVTELRYGMYGDYLKMRKPTSQQWKDYQKMRGDVTW
jgi:hypothetical protein